MMGFVRQIAALVRRDQTGSITVETAFIVPVMLALSIGGFETSTMIARQAELQGAAAEGAAIVRAAIPEDSTDRTAIRNIIATSTGLAQNKITVLEKRRCATGYDEKEDGNCTGSNLRAKYVEIEINDTYDPIWTQFGIGSSINYELTRTVQIG